MRKHEENSPWEDMEQQALHAYQEWPLFLKMRLRQLRTHLAAKPSQQNQSELLAAYGLKEEDKTRDGQSG